MIIWRILTEAAKTEGIDSNAERAFAWIRRHLPELFVQPLDGDGKPYRDEQGGEEVEARFPWERDWPTWQRMIQEYL